MTTIQEPQKGTMEEMALDLADILSPESYNRDASYPAIQKAVTYLHHQLQKALEIQAIEIREEEANEYNKIIEQELQKERERCITKAWSYIVDATHAESWSRDELRKAVQSELDQPDALTK